MDLRFFETSHDFRKWLEENHAGAQELWVGFYKVNSGKPSITWPESVDQALCFGWIDGIRKSVDDVSYAIRFSPRKPGSIWSAVNIKRIQELAEKGLVHPAGISAFEKRKENKSGIYSYEQRSVDLPSPYAEIFKQNQAAWEFYEAQPASYRKAAYWYVLSAKKEETRLQRLENLISVSSNKQRLFMFTREAAKK
jgi:uncharacterized protein YdeI (YjbR/CyaY-like superfamily)